MPINNFSVGRDINFTLTSSSGLALALNGLTDYTIKPVFSKLKHKGLHGTTIHAAIPDGWELSVKIERRDPTIDNFFAQLEVDYFNGKNLSNGTISETIQEPDGSITQFQYTGVSLTYEDAGSWKGDSLISIGLSGMASRRNKIS